MKLAHFRTPWSRALNLLAGLGKLSALMLCITTAPLLLIALTDVAVSAQGSTHRYPPG